MTIHTNHPPIAAGLTVEVWNIVDVHPYDKNPRRNDAAVAKVASSLAEFGWRQPLVVDENGILIAGHTRLKAAKELGLTEVPVHVARGMSADQVRAYRLADNRIGEEAEWDEQLLALEIRELDGLGFDLSLTGFNKEELAGLLSLSDEEIDALDDLDQAPELEDGPTVSQLGDLWRMPAAHGDHMLIVGDSTSRAVLERLMGGAKADAIWTDPPYNVNYEGTAGKIQNDNMGDKEFAGFLAKAYDAMHHVTREGGPIYVAHADTEGVNFRTEFRRAGFKLSGCLVWVKPGLVLGRSDYQWRHEPLLYGWKEGAAHAWYGGRANTTVLDGKDAPVAIQADGSVHITIGDKVVVITGDNIDVQTEDTTILRFDKPSRNGEHPTMKPIDLIERCLLNSTKAGDIVLDSFGGSGSTMVAAHINGRVARLCELDPRYADVILRRFVKLGGTDPVRERDGRTFSQVAKELGL